MLISYSDPVHFLLSNHSMKLLLPIAAAILLAGCVGPTVYGRPGNTPEQERKDFAECKFESLKATGSGPGGTVTNEYTLSNTIANDLAAGMRQGEIMQACLIAKGYSPQSQ